MCDDDMVARQEMTRATMSFMRVSTGQRQLLLDQADDAHTVGFSFQ